MSSSQFFERQPLGGRRAQLAADALMGEIRAPEFRTVGQVAGASAYQHGERVSLFNMDYAVFGSNRAALVEQPNFRLVGQTVVEPACSDKGSPDWGPARCGLGIRPSLAGWLPHCPGGCVVRIRKFEGARIRTGLAGREAENQHLGREVGKVLAVVGATASRVVDRVDGVFETQLTAVRSRVRRAVVEIQEEVGQVLIAAGVFFRAGPQGDLVELEMLVLRIAEDHGAEAAVADRQGLGLPILRGLTVGEHETWIGLT